jgi:hypothetical protein
VPPPPLTLEQEEDAPRARWDAVHGRKYEYIVRFEVVVATQLADYCISDWSLQSIRVMVYAIFIVPFIILAI